MELGLNNKFKITKPLNDIKSLNKHQVVIKLYLSYAYCDKKSKHFIKTSIVNLNRISLNDLLTKVEKSVCFKSVSISYNETGDEIYCYCGLYPLTELILCELTPSKSLWVKLRRDINDSYRVKLDLFEEEEIKNISLNDNTKTNHHINKKSRRNNERVIGDVITKVYLWKKLSLGIINDKGKLVKMTLEEAAECCQIKKKSLIDYHHKLQFGRLLGFDFNKHRNEKVNVLRGYVKNQLELLGLSSIKNLKKRKKLDEMIEAEQLSAVEKQDEVLSS